MLVLRRWQDLLDEVFCGGYPGSRANLSPKDGSMKNIACQARA
jgi:hypothetical protein